MNNRGSKLVNLTSENSLSVFVIAILLGLFVSMLGEYVVYGILGLLFVVPFIIYGEKYIIFFIIVTLFTLVGDINKDLRAVIHILDFSLLALLFLYHYGFQIKEYPKIPRSLIYFLLLYYFSMVLAIVMSEHVYDGLQKIGRQTIFFGVAYLLYSLIRKEDDLKSILYGIIAASVIIAFSTMINFYSQGFELADYAAGIAVRVTGLMSNILATTTYFIVAMPLLIVFLLTQDKRSIKNLLWIFIIVLLIGIILTASRSAMLAIIASTMIIFYFYNKKLITSLLLILIFISLIFLFIPPFNEISSIIFRIESGLSQRQHYWSLAYNMIKDNLLFGIGPGSYGYEMYNYFPVMLNSWIGKVIIETNLITGGNNNSHNFFLVFFSDMGVPGLLTALTLPVVFFKIALKTIKKYKNSNKVTYYTVIGLAAAGTSMFVRGFVDGIGLLAYGFITADMPFWLMFISLIYYNLKIPNDIKSLSSGSPEQIVNNSTSD